MPDSFSASVTIARLTRWAPASCMRAQRMPGARVVPRPAPAKWAMNRRLVWSMFFISVLRCQEGGSSTFAKGFGGPP